MIYFWWFWWNYERLLLVSQFTLSATTNGCIIWSISSRGSHPDSRKLFLTRVVSFYRARRAKKNCWGVHLRFAAIQNHGCRKFPYIRREQKALKLTVSRRFLCGGSELPIRWWHYHDARHLVRNYVSFKAFCSLLVGNTWELSAAMILDSSKTQMNASKVFLSSSSSIEWSYSG